jgi:nuclear pore complex protein Nup98-Nup96
MLLYPTNFAGSLFGQKPSFGGFGSSPSQSSPFGGAFQQTQPAFGNTTFGATTTPAFGTTPTPAFGATTTPAFGSTSTSLFGASSTPAFGSTPFGSTTTPAFGSSGSTTAFGVSSAPAFGASTTPSFGASTSAFSFGSSPSFGQTAAAAGTTPFGTTPSPFGAQTSPFGGQTTAPAFGQASFGNQSGGTRVQPYAQTPDADSATSGQPAAKLNSISAMPAYKDKSHEELRWEDYQRGDKGGPNTSAAPVANSFASPQPIFQANPTTPANPFAKASTGGFGATPNPFSSATIASFGQTSSSAFSANTSPSLFGNTTTSLFSTPSTTTNPFNTGLSINNTQSAGLFQSSPAMTQQPFSQSFNQQSSTPAFSTGMFNTSNPGMTGGLFSNTSSPFQTVSIIFPCNYHIIVPIM